MADLQDHIETIDRYVEAGYEPGSGTRAVLENDLAGAMARLDCTSRLIVFDIVGYLVKHCPPECWGSRQNVDAWIRAKREERKTKNG